MSVALAGDGTKYERLRYLTENFKALQGLTWVCLGGWLLLSEIERIPGVVLPWWFHLLGIGPLVVAIRYIPKYYERRFGSVESRVSFDAKSLILMFVFVVLLFLWPFVGQSAKPLVTELSNAAHRMISDSDHKANLLPILYCAVLLCAAVSNRSHFGRARMVVFSACLLLLWTGVLVFLPLRYPEVTQQTPWRILNAGWFGISLMLLGLFDHLTLVHLLPSRGQNTHNE